MVEAKRLYGEEHIPLDVIAELKRAQVMTPHFPKEGVGYLDVFSLLGDPDLAKKTHDAFQTLYDPEMYDVIVAIGSRGYLFGAPLAYLNHKPLVPATKYYKNPRDVIVNRFQTEEFDDPESVEIQCDRHLERGARVLIVDDLIATGGSARAVIEIIRNDFPCLPIGIAVVNKLSFAGYRDKIPQACEVRGIIPYDKTPNLPQYDPAVHTRHEKSCTPCGN